MIQAKQLTIILVLAFVGWILCGAIMGIGLAVTSQMNAVIVHALGAPIVLALISLFYFKKFRYTTPFQTAVIFVVFIILMDFFVVAIVINRSFDMFASLLGTWIPFVSIFLSTYLVGLYVKKVG
jgi:hypothetical protein